ncbi:TIGR01440 family protein [Bacillus sp. CGMCC 1.16541]|uniref:TIGR01440 family protein n=1 Tax=Bacillus sp. CGMCC 1.16541 TaxID=2185143 RepID=UPI000D73357C|nr:TIGR01440 family protein [Bacillus sp. CGMCC 1.16541]
MSILQWQEELQTILHDFHKQINITRGQLMVIGCSTSEVVGERIGTAGTKEVAEMLFRTFTHFQQETGVSLAFQCCEHLNRALVVEKEVAEKRGLEVVSVIPIRKAGGAMATYAYHHFKNPVVVEFIKADAGIDIGDTFIGMHLKHVAVPVRCSIKQIGNAHVTFATTRPKLIGGVRAVYEQSEENEEC